MLAWDPVHQKEAFRIPYPHPGQRRHHGHGRQSAGRRHHRQDPRDLPRRQRQEALGDAGRDRAGGRADDLSASSGTQYIAVNAGWNSAIVHGLDEGGKPFSVAPGAAAGLRARRQGRRRCRRRRRPRPSRRRRRKPSRRQRWSRRGALLAPTAPSATGRTPSAG